MSKALNTLKRLHRTAIEEVGQALAAMIAQGGQIEAEIAAARAQLEAEQAAAAGDALAASMLGPYTQQVRARIAAMQRQRAIILAQEDEARDALAAAYLEEKQIEQLIEAAAALAQDREAAREAQFMDELAISNARFR